MQPSFVLEYNSQGGPLLIAEADAAVHWNGTEDDGSGVLVEYMGKDVFKLPKELIQTKKQHRQSKQCTTLKEAQAFQKKVLAAFAKVHPKAARYPGSEQSPCYYIGDQRIYSVELRHTSMYESISKRLKSNAQVLVLDKGNKAQGVFMDQDGGGPGLIMVDEAAGALAIGKPHTQLSCTTTELAERVAAASVPKAKAKIALGGLVFIFEAALSQADIARTNWKEPALAKALKQVQAAARYGPLQVPDQKPPGGAYVQLPASQYALSYKDDADTKLGVSVLWLSPIA